jgi:hypothetical protein
VADAHHTEELRGIGVFSATPTARGSASSRLLDLKGEAIRFKKRNISATIVAGVKRFCLQIKRTRFRYTQEGKLDLTAFVMQEDAEFLHDVIPRNGLDVVSPQDLQGLIARYPNAEYPPKSAEKRVPGHSTWFDTYPGRGAN